MDKEGEEGRKDRREKEEKKIYFWATEHKAWKRKGKEK